MYYLQSRYYDPSIGRFINADGYITTGQGILSSNIMYGSYGVNYPKQGNWCLKIKLVGSNGFCFLL